MANEKRLIDANALRTDTMVMCGVNEAVLENCYPYWQFNKAIVNAPTVDAVEVVHGRWDKYEDDKFIGYDANGRMQYRKVYTYYCDRCGRGTAVKTNYCPNCGAKMGGGA